MLGKGDSWLYETNDACRDDFSTTHPDIEWPKPKAKYKRWTQTDVTSASISDTHIGPSKEIIYETPKRELVREVNDDDNDEYYDDEFLDEDAKSFGREDVGPVGSPYLMP